MPVAGLVVIGHVEMVKMVAKMEVMVVVDEVDEVISQKNDCRMRKIYKIKLKNTCALIIYTPFGEESPRSRVVKKNPDLAYIREG